MTTGGRGVWRQRLIAIAGMTAIWILLWGDLSWGNALGGVAVAIVVMVIFPLPHIAFHGRLRAWGTVRFLAYFTRDLIVSSGQVAWAAVRPRGRLRNAVIAVPLRVRTDLNLTMTAEALTLIPGSLIVDARRDTGVLYVHVLDVRDIEDVERFRRGVLDLEARLIRAFGSADEIRQIEAEEAP